MDKYLLRPSDQPFKFSLRMRPMNAGQSGKAMAAGLQ